MKTVIFVGGASASGKTTLANDLNKEFSNSIKYRRYQLLFTKESIIINRNFIFILLIYSNNIIFRKKII